jgi:uncharacterized protein
MNEIAVIVVVALAGFMRGITGFGGAMLMAPPLSLLIGAVPTVVTALILETAAALVMFPDALPKINKRVLLYLTPPACFTVPIGGYLLVTLDPLIARKIISMVVAVCSLILLCGLRYTGSHRPATSMILGGIVGVMLGSTSVGAPPVILYLLSGPDPQAVTRANLTVFVTAISVIGLVMLFAAGDHTAHNVGFLAVHSLYGNYLAGWDPVLAHERSWCPAAGARLHARDEYCDARSVSD